MNWSAFISYSHSQDATLAPLLQQALQRFAKRWHERRALSIFRDDSNLSTSAKLWSSIVGALETSEFFVLLCSRGAARSPWIAREVAWWCEHRPMERMLLVLTDGELAWDTATQDFRWSDETPLPVELKGRFPEEPRLLDLRWATGAGAGLAPDNYRFRNAVADLAATLHGRPKDDLIGEDARQFRRVKRLTRVAIASLVLLTLAAGTAAYVAIKQKNFAEQERAEAERQRDAAAANLAVAQEATDTLVSKVAAAARDLHGVSESFRLQLLQAADAVFAKLERRSAASSELLLQRGKLNHLMAEAYQSLGEVEAAIRRVDAGLEASRAASGDSTGELPALLLTYDLLHLQARLLGSQGNVEAAKEFLSEADAVLERARRAPGAATNGRLRAILQVSAAEALARSQAPGGAGCAEYAGIVDLPGIDAALASEANPPTPFNRMLLAGLVGGCAHQMDDLNTAVTLLEFAMAVALQQVEPEGAYKSSGRLLRGIADSLARVYLRAGQAEQARKTLAAAMPFARALVAAEPDNIEFIQELASLLLHTGDANLLEQRAEARQSFDEATALARQILGQTSKSVEGQRLLVTAMTGSARALDLDNDLAAAIERAGEASEAAHQMMKTGGGVRELDEAAAALDTFAQLLAKNGDFVKARLHLREALAYWRDLAEAEPQVPIYRAYLIEPLARLATWSMEDDRQLAGDYLHEADRLLESFDTRQLDDESLLYWAIRGNLALGSVTADLAQVDRARERFSQAVALAERLPASRTTDGVPMLMVALEAQGEFERLQGDSRAAIKHLDRCSDLAGEHLHLRPADQAVKMQQMLCGVFAAHALYEANERSPADAAYQADAGRFEALVPVFLEAYRTTGDRSYEGFRFDAMYRVCDQLWKAEQLATAREWCIRASVLGEEILKVENSVQYAVLLNETFHKIARLNVRLDDLDQGLEQNARHIAFARWYEQTAAAGPEAQVFMEYATAARDFFAGSQRQRQ